MGRARPITAALGALAWTTLLAGPEETELAEGVTPSTN